MSFINKYIGQSQKNPGRDGYDYTTFLWALGNDVTNPSSIGSYTGTFSASLYGNSSYPENNGFVTGFIGLTNLSNKVDVRISVLSRIHANASIQYNSYGSPLLAITATEGFQTSRPYYCNLSMSITGNNLKLPTAYFWI